MYLGGNYSARAYAKNFTDEEILRAIDHAHLYGRKVYMTLNILLKDKEIGGITSYLRPFYLAGLDGVIVQDIGLFGLLRKAMPDLPLHASTQMAVTDIAGVELLSKLGAKRVVLARELSLDEIQNIRERSDMPLECFIHGALCYSYSGKCLMSSMLEDRSGNRGRCAQPCRLPYDGEYLLSCRDICTLELLPSLIEAGIASFKIEGRMNSPDYVTLVTSVYRKHMDLYKADPAGYTVDGEDLKRLQELYGRCGHSSGYYIQHNGRNMITVKKPGYEKGDAKDRQMMNGLLRNDPTPLPVDLSATFRQGEAVRVTAESHDVSVTVTGPVAEPAKTRGLGIDEIKKQYPLPRFPARGRGGGSLLPAGGTGGARGSAT